MKKLLLIALIGIAFFSNAQETEGTDFKKNEVKFNLLGFVLGDAEVSYERNLSDISSLGISVLLPISKERRWEINYFITPYYRIFFGNKPAQGFFIEGFGMLTSVNHYNFHERYDGNAYYIELEKATAIEYVLGFGVGGKFILKDKILAEVGFGLGRNLNPYLDYQNPLLVPRFNIGFGYRF